MSPHSVCDTKRARTSEEAMDTPNEKDQCLILASATASSIQLPCGSESRVLPVNDYSNLSPIKAEDLRRVVEVPTVLFNSDGGIESVWSATVVESMFQYFSRYCFVNLHAKQYNVDPVMRYSLPDFNRWYLAETATPASTIRFSIYREGKLERGYPGCKVDMYFYLLRQCIWDYFWETSEVEPISPSFYIVVAPCKDLDLTL